MMGDVPVGVFLSGGLDSALVAAIAARDLAARGERLQTFAVGTEDSPDLAAARVVAAHLGTEHRERVVHRRARRSRRCPTVVRAIESFDPSLVRSAVPNYLLAEMTAQHVKVVLTGEGADELFAGYEYLRDFADPDDAARRARAHRPRPAQPQPPALRPRDDGPRPRGARARSWTARSSRGRCGLPPGWKLPAPGEPEKRLLREAFEGWLPDELLWREKAEFGDGSGAKDVLHARSSRPRSPTADFARERDAVDAAAAHAARSSPTTGSSASTCPASGPSVTLSRFARA